MRDELWDWADVKALGVMSDMWFCNVGGIAKGVEWRGDYGETSGEYSVHAAIAAALREAYEAGVREGASPPRRLTSEQRRALSSHPDDCVCNGEGWVWRRELPDTSDWDGSADDTQYDCPYGTLLEG